MKKMNIGLVGAGFMGKAHMVAFSNMPKLFTDAPFIPVFKTVCDIVPEIAEDFKERYGFEKACTDFCQVPSFSIDQIRPMASHIFRSLERQRYKPSFQSQQCLCPGK